MPTKAKKESLPKDHLAPIQELLHCIEDCYGKLQSLLATTPEKLQNALTDFDAKVKKAKEKQQKAKSQLAAAKQKYKTKANEVNKKRLANVESALKEAQTTHTALVAEHKQLTAQLHTCKAMKKEYAAIAKAIQKTEKSFQKKQRKTSAQARKKRGTMKASAEKAGMEMKPAM